MAPETQVAYVKREATRSEGDHEERRVRASRINENCLCFFCVCFLPARPPARTHTDTKRKFQGTTVMVADFDDSRQYSLSHDAIPALRQAEYSVCTTLRQFRLLGRWTGFLRGRLRRGSWRRRCGFRRCQKSRFLSRLLLRTNQSLANFWTNSNRKRWNSNLEESVLGVCVCVLVIRKRCSTHDVTLRDNAVEVGTFESILRFRFSSLWRLSFSSSSRSSLIA